MTSQNSNALEIIDISDPANPVYKGNIINGDSGALLSNPWGIYVSGTYAYIASLYSHALEIVDLGIIPASGVTVVSPTKITGSFDLTGRPVGQYDVVVTNPDGQYGILANGFTVTTLPTPKPGSLEVKSSPSHAKIYINGIDTGKFAKWTFEGMAPGDYDISVMLDGYATPATEKLKVVSGQTMKLHFMLKRIK